MPYFTNLELYVTGGDGCRKRRNYGDIHDVKNDDRDETRGKDIPEAEQAADVTTVKQDVKEKNHIDGALAASV